MQPFDKHPADGAALQAYGDELIAQGAQALQLGISTRQAYSPAVPSVEGVPAPAVAAAPEPVDQASMDASGSLVWGAVATQYWGDQVTDFNAEVDRIVAELEAAQARVKAASAAQTPPAGTQGPNGTDPVAQAGLAEALGMAVVLKDAQDKWHRAHDTFIMQGGTRAAAMLQDGPTAANQKVAREAGIMPDVEFTGLMNLITKSGARFLLVTPQGQEPFGPAIYFGERLLNAVSYADRAWRSLNLRFHPGGPPLDASRVYDNPGMLSSRPTAIGPAAPFAPGTSIADKARAFQDPANWTASTADKARTAAGLGRVSTVAGPLGAALAGAAGAVDQYTRDEGRTDLSQTERNARAAGRGGAAAAGSLGGAWLGGKAGAALGSLSGNPIVAGVGAVGGAIAGGIFGGAAVNTVVDEILAPPPTPTTLAPGPEFTPAPQPGGLSGPV